MKQIPRKYLGSAYLILIYDYKGEYRGVVRLEPRLNPVNIAAFPSGDVLAVSLDKLNQTTRLLIFDLAGRPVKELRLFDEDYWLKLQPADKAEKTSSTGNNELPKQKLASAEWVPFVDNLLLASGQSRLPWIEVNESGVARSTTAVLPEGAIIGALVASGDRVYHALVGHQTMNSAQGSVGGSPANPAAGFFPDEIDDIYPGDGSVLKLVRLDQGMIPTMPVCVQGDTYTFVAPRAEDGELQVIHGTAIH
jgi:hypothetical protein